MRTLRPYMTDFTRGEVSPRFEGRFDLPDYYKSCRTLENFLLNSTGGAERTPGTVYLADAEDQTSRCRLIPFEYSPDENFVIEFFYDSAKAYYKVWKAGDHSVNKVKTQFGADAWTAAQVLNIKYTQMGNTMYVVEPGHAPHKIVFTSPATWTVTAPVFTDAPWSDATDWPAAVTFHEQRLVMARGLNLWGSKVQDYEHFRTTLKDFSITGATQAKPVVITATGHPFSNDEVITFLNVQGMTELNGNIYMVKNKAANTFELYTQDGNSQIDGTGYTAYTSGGICSRPIYDDDAYSFKIIADKNQDAQWLVSHNVLVSGSRAAEWIIHGNGDPIAPTVLVSPLRQTTYGSCDLQAILANDAVIYAQKGGKHLRNFLYSSDRKGYLSPDLTALAEHILSSGIVDMAFQQIPDSIIWCVTGDGDLVGLTYQQLVGIAGWHRQTTGGNVEAVTTVTNGDEDEIWIEVSRTGGRYIEYFKPREHYTVATQEDCFFVHSGITLYGGAAEDIEDATQAKPVVVTITGHSFANDDLVKITGVAGMTELNSNVYMVKNKAANTFELYLTDGTTQVDGTGFGAYTSGGECLKVYDTVDGLTHLEGETVDVLADGATHPQKTVDTGEITLDRYASKIHVGLPYISKLKPQRFGQAPDVMKRIERVVIRFFQSLGCKVGPDENNLETLSFRKGTDPMDSPPPLFTGDKEVSPFRGGHEKAGDLLIIQDQPLPLNVLAIMPKVSVSG